MLANANASSVSESSDLWHKQWNYSPIISCFPLRICPKKKLKLQHRWKEKNDFGSLESCILNGWVNQTRSSVSKKQTNTEASNCITSKCFLCQNEARKLNHQEVVEEDKKLKLPSNWEAKKARLEWELADSEKRKVRVFFVFFSTCKVSHSPWNQPERRRVTMCRSVRQTAKTTTEWKCWRSQLMMPSVGRGRRRRRTQILDLQVWLSGTMLEA